ncbi:MAG TPA: glycosyltransferase family 4 protein [Anaerolineae bacterium]|nr:glycosyltransferase family 4 protein [Anaerolineae bacterium]
MRLLFVSAFYPPHIVGGWEQLVSDINQKLQNRGHDTQALTSRYGLAQAEMASTVWRCLHLESDIYHYKPGQIVKYPWHVKQNLDYTRQVVAQFKPDVVFVHVMWNLSWGVPWLLEQSCPGRVVYYVANDWPTADDPHTAYWQNHAARSPWRGYLKKLAAWGPQKMVDFYKRKFRLEFRRVLCVSHAIKNHLSAHSQIDDENLYVVNNGVEIDLFAPRPSWHQQQKAKDHLTLLYAGSLNDHKGVHTAIEAMAQLVAGEAEQSVTLTIAGAGHIDYEARLRKLVAEYKLEERVTFLGRVPRTEIPTIMQAHDVLLLPSTWEEPLSRVMQEGMACGLLVIGTLTGGTGELLVEGETGLSFAPHDADGLAAQIRRVIGDDDFYWGMAQKGYEEVVSHFNMTRMIDEIEMHLTAVNQLAP